MAYFPPTGSTVAFQTVPGNLHASVTGTVAIAGSIIANAGVQPGSVVAFQGTTPWQIGSVYGNLSGSVVAFQGGTKITSLVSTVPSSVIVGASIFGTAPVTQAGTWIASVFGNVSVIGTVPVTQATTPWNIAGSVATIQSGTNITSLVSTVPSSVIVGASIFGTAPVTQSGTWVSSALGYVVRNDAVASALGADLTYRVAASDSAGRQLVKPFAAEEARVEGYHSVVSTSVTTLVAAAGAGLRNYITDIILANTGAATTLVTFRSGGGTSVLGYGIAPAGGGSNMMSFATPMRTLANETFDFQPTTATSILFATVKGFKAP